MQLPLAETLLMVLVVTTRKSPAGAGGGVEADGAKGVVVGKMALGYELAWQINAKTPSCKRRPRHIREHRIRAVEEVGGRGIDSSRAGVEQRDDVGGGEGAGADGEEVVWW